MSDKKILKEDFTPEGAWAPTFRAGDEVEDVQIKLFGLEGKVVGAHTKAGESILEERTSAPESPLGTASDSSRVTTKGAK